MDFEAALAEIKRCNLYRKLCTISTPPGREAVIDGKKALLFSSNSYLGLADEPFIKQRAIRAVEQYGTGSGGSRLVTGNMTPHMELEKVLAEFTGTEACLLFNSGYTANLGAISALADRDSFIFSDALNHASIIDGCRLSRATTIIYRHNDPDDLAAKIREIQPQKGLIVTDGVFSMNGDLARLPDLVRIKQESGLLLMIDDAHATGVLGRTGRGSLEHFGLSGGSVDVLMGTLSKAIPGEGGFVCGSAGLCDFLKNKSRPFIYTTAMSPGAAATGAAAVRYIDEHPELVRRLQENIRYFSERLALSGISARQDTAIIPVPVGEEGAAMRAGEDLFGLGVFVPCIRYPTVAKGQARLRFTIMAAHTQGDMDYAVDRLEEVLIRHIPQAKKRP